MAQELKDVFRANSRSIRDIFATDAGFYIPAYQRPYSWVKKDAEKLIDDISSALSSFIGGEDSSVCFLGSIVLIHDREYDTIEPRNVADGELPTAVYSVIDGQQRLTTLMLFSIILYNKIRLYSNSKLVKSISSLNNVSNDICNDLRKVFMLNREMGEFPLYPKIVKTYDDEWGCRSTSFRYSSPVAKIAKGMIDHIKEMEDKTRYTEISLSDEGSTDDEKNIMKMYKTLETLLMKYIEKTDETEANYYDVEKLLSRDKFSIKTFSNEKISSEDKTNILKIYEKEEELDSAEKRLISLIKLLILSDFVLNRVGVTEIMAENYSYAFSVFEALNTAGEPLTSFEGFKPKVMETVGLKQYRESEEKEEVDIIERCLGAANKKTNTQDLVTSFALFYDGTTLGSEVNAQRRYLLDEYNKIASEDNTSGTTKEQKDFIKNLARVANFQDKAWRCKHKWNDTNGPNNYLSLDHHEYKVELDDDAKLALTFLIDCKHKVVLGLLSRFYSEAIDKKDGSELSQVIKACASFFVLFTAFYGGAEKGLPAIHTKLMSDGLDVKDDNVNKVDPVSYTKNENGISSIDIKRVLNEVLESHVNNKNVWIEEVAKKPIKQSTCTILLLAASHQRSVDEKGMLQNNMRKEANLDMMNLARYYDETVSTFEHVAPRNPRGGHDWDPNIYNNNAQNIDCLGNGILIPQNINSIQQNKNWNVKLLTYKLLMTKTESEFNVIKDDLYKLVKVKIPITSEETIQSSQFLPHVESVSKAPDWSLQHIYDRGANIAECAWDELIKWLK